MLISRYILVVWFGIFTHDFNIYCATTDDTTYSDSRYRTVKERQDLIQAQIITMQNSINLSGPTILTPEERAGLDSGALSDSQKRAISYRMQPITSVKTWGSKTNPLKAGSVSGSTSNLSLSRHHTKLNHPTSSSLFPSHPGLAPLFDDFMSQLETDSSFIPRFSKLHFFILHEIYAYLVQIYTTLNLTHVSTMSDLLASESKIDGMALNKKTMVIEHLFNLIEAQVNGFIQQKWPSLPQQIATTVGTMFTKADFGTQYTMMLRDVSDAAFSNATSVGYGNQIVKDELRNTQNRYLTTFGKYLAFNRAYTQDLNVRKKVTDPVTDVQIDSALNEFIDHAKRISTTIEALSQVNTAKVSNLSSNYTVQIAKANSYSAGIKNKTLNFDAMVADMSAVCKPIVDVMRSIERINPPLFFYNESALRGITIIPHLAQLIPPQSKKVPWPQAIVCQAADPGSKIRTRPLGVQPPPKVDGRGCPTATGSIWTNTQNPNGLRVATFLTDKGTQTYDVNAAKTLIVNIPTSRGGIYMQKIIPQPDWLNSSDGIIAMLRACLGDFSILLRNPLLAHEMILDPLIVYIIYSAAQKVGGLDIPTGLEQSIAKAKDDFITTLAPQEAPPVSIDMENEPPDISDLSN
jgi:hypothetical protein